MAMLKIIVHLVDWNGYMRFLLREACQRETSKAFARNARGKRMAARGNQQQSLKGLSNKTILHFLIKTWKIEVICT